MNNQITPTSSLNTLDGRVKSLWTRISPASRTSFLACFLAGFVIHLFAFTNLIPNADGLSRMNDLQQMTVSGRWFLHYATAFNAYIQAPALIGFLSVLFLSLAAAFMVGALRMRSRVLAGLAGVLFIAFPSVAYTYLYMFTASAYFFGILLAVVAVWLTDRFRLGLLPGAVLLACALGTYQAYVAIAAALSLLLVLLVAMRRESDGKGILIHGVRHLVFLGLGVGLYAVTLKIFLTVKDLQLLEYLGMRDTAGAYPFSEIPAILKKTYIDFAGSFLLPGKVVPYTTLWVVLLNGLIFAAGAVLFVRLLQRERVFRRPVVLVLSSLMLLLLPLAMNLVQVMNPNGSSTPIMRLAFVFAYQAVLVLLDRQEVAEEVQQKEPNGEGRKSSGSRRAGAIWNGVLRGAVLIPLLALLLNFAQTDNLVYTAANQAHRATLSFATRLVDRVESAPGYAKGMEIVVIGPMPLDVYTTDLKAYQLVKHYSCLPYTVLTSNKHVYYYLNDWLNVPWPEPEEETMKAVSDSAVFQAMPLYPSDGCVQVIDGRVVVRLAKAYKPKEAYEIAYENRR